MPADSSPTEHAMAEAVTDGDWKRCGACGTRGTLGVEATREGARFQCRRCRTWNLIPVPKAAA